MSAVSEVDVVVVGGGVAGLTAAWDLTRGGLRTVVLEAQPRVGGLVQTEQAGAYVIEGGPDSMLVQKPAGLALCRELGLDSELVPTLEPRTAYVLRDGALHPLPSEAVLGLPVSREAIARCGMLSAEGRAALERDLDAPAAVPAPDVASLKPATDESLASLIGRRLGEEAVRFIAQPLLGGIHAGDATRLSVQALFPMLADADARAGSFLDALRPRRATPTPDGAFRGLRRGMATLTDRLAEALRAGPGGDTAIAPGVRVERLTPGSRITVDTPDGRLHARAVVLAIPAYAAASVVASFDADLAHACAAIRYTSTATVTLAYRRTDVARCPTGTGFVVPRGERSTRLLATSWVTSKWPGRAPDDVVMMRAFAGGVLDADLLELSDAELVALAARDLGGLIGLRHEPILTRVSRWLNASAQYEVGHAGRVAAVESGAARWPGLWFTGSAWRGVGIPDCVADARAVAARVARTLAI